MEIRNINKKRRAKGMNDNMLFRQAELDPGNVQEAELWPWGGEGQSIIQGSRLMSEPPGRWMQVTRARHRACC